jgi:hypothetical protein
VLPGRDNHHCPRLSRCLKTNLPIFLAIIKEGCLAELADVWKFSSLPLSREKLQYHPSKGSVTCDKFLMPARDILSEGFVDPRATSRRLTAPVKSERTEKEGG